MHLRPNSKALTVPAIVAALAPTLTIAGRAKWAVGVELSNDPKHLGYWEQRGYSQTGLRSQNMFSAL